MLAPITGTKVKPWFYSREENGVEIKRPIISTNILNILNEPMPCDGCEDAELCGACELACEAFWLYENKATNMVAKRRSRGMKWDWRDGLRIPAHSWYRLSFPERD